MILFESKNRRKLALRKQTKVMLRALYIFSAKLNLFHQKTKSIILIKI